MPGLLSSVQGRKGGQGDVRSEAEKKGLWSGDVSQRWSDWLMCAEAQGLIPNHRAPEQSREHRPGFGVRGEAYLGVAVDVHAVVSIDAFRTDNLTVSLQGLQLEKFSGGQKLESIKRDC